jgi:Tol biopolymer transport system component
MLLKAGDRIGGYEVVSLLGAGGMGEVYRARDARLGRDVAIKVLSPSIAADTDGLMRFEREARLLASLNHPNIAAIYGVEDGAGHPALILELVEGETLADRIARGPIPIAEALTYARQIADALDTAHEAGIVHRDLKPANIKITEGGTIKVLDFGLAKAIAAAATPLTAVDPSRSPTVTVHGTKHGVILGTVAYMSPEQARGKPIDKRTDIWAFGCVLFEMLTGRMTFSGETTSDVIAAIIERAPDWSKLPASTPAHIRRVIERCLEKDPKRRARDIADVRAELEGPHHGMAAPPRPQPRLAWLATGAVIVASIAAFAVGRTLWRPLPAPPGTEFTVVPPDGSTLANAAVPSPDGRQLAFIVRDGTGAGSIWVRPIADLKAVPLPGTEGVAGQLIWSPDSRSIGFFAAGRLKTIPANGGPVVIVCPMTSHLGATWGPDDVILLSPVNRTSIHRVPATGGTPEPVTTLDTTRENSHRWPHFLPDGRNFVYTVRTDSAANNAIYLSSLDGGAPTRLFAAQSNAIYVDPGYLLHVRDGTLLAQPFNPRSLKLTGSPRPVAAAVWQEMPSAAAGFNASTDGSVLSYRRGDDRAVRLTWFDRTGRNLGTLGPSAPYQAVNLSPDGRRAAVDMVDVDHGTRDVWIVEPAGTLRRFTSHTATDWMAVWSPDGASLAFASDRLGHSSVFRAPADGSAPEQLLFRGASGAFPDDWAPGGRQVLIHMDGSRGEPFRSSYLVPLDGGKPVSLLEASFPVTYLRFSPDGGRVAYHSPETGEHEIYVMSLADRRRIRISTEGGLLPTWTRGGRELLYVNARREIMSVAMAANGLEAQPPIRLFAPCGNTDPPSIFIVGPNFRAFSAVTDGSRVLALCASDQTASGSTVVSVNWQAKLPAP